MQFRILYIERERERECGTVASGVMWSLQWQERCEVLSRKKGCWQALRLNVSVLEIEIKEPYHTVPDEFVLKKV